MSGTSWESEMPWERMLLRTYRMFQADIQMNAPKDRTLFNYKLVYWLCNTVEGPIKKIDNKILNFNFSFQKNSKRARIVLRKLKKHLKLGNLLLKNLRVGFLVGLPDVQGSANLATRTNF